MMKQEQKTKAIFLACFTKVFGEFCRTSFLTNPCCRLNSFSLCQTSNVPVYYFPIMPEKL